MAALNGNTGNVSGNGIVASLNTWSATITRAASDVTEFTDAGRKRLLGVYDLTGSAGGVIDTKSGFANTTLGELICHTAVTGAAITLAARSNTSGTNHIVFNGVCDSVNLASSKGGDATVTFNFSLSHTNGTNSPFTIVWAV